MTTTQNTSSTARLEHVNVTVSDPDKTAAMLIEIFGWHVRWSGGSIHDGRTVHVGTDDDYLALYTPGEAATGATDSYRQVSGLNHVALLVDDLDAIEQRVINAGLDVGEHYDYEPGRRFYFRDHDNIEFEVVSYA